VQAGSLRYGESILYGLDALHSAPPNLAPSFSKGAGGRFAREGARATRTRFVPQPCEPEYTWWYAAAEAPRYDCQLAEINRSTEFASHGASSLKVVFTRHEQGARGYVILEPSIDNQGLNLTDWSDCDTLVIDVYNPHKQAAKMGFRIVDASKRSGGKRNIYFPPGWSRAIWQIQRLDLNLAQIAMVTFSMAQPDQDFTLYFDNIHLQRRQAAQADGLVEQLMTARKLLTDLPGRIQAGIAPVVQWLQRLATQGCDVSGQLDVASEEKLAQLRDRLDALGAEATDALNETLKLLSTTILDTVPALSLATTPDYSLAAFEVGEPVPSPTEPGDLIALERLVEQAETRFAESKLRRRLEEQFTGEDFGVGLSPTYEKIAYRPQTYDGPIGRDVEISAARNEYEPFVLLLLSFDSPLEGVTVRVSKLSRVDGGGVIAPENIEVAPMGYCRPRSHQPLQAYQLRPDIKTFDLPVGVQQAVWVNVYVPLGTPPGEYRGVATIAPSNAKPQEVEIKLAVRSFTLPERPSLLSAGSFNPPSVNDTVELAYVKLMTQHRWCAHRIYQWPVPPPPETIRKWVEMGVPLINLLRLSRMHGQYERDEQGNIISYRKDIRENYLNRLREPVRQLKEAGLFEYCYVYGFDEPTAAMVPALEDMFGAVKEEFGLRTMFTIYLPIWREHPRISNVDYYCVTPQWLTPELIAQIRQSGSQVWWYNISGGDWARSQFWSTYKSGLEGVLHYSLTAKSTIREIPFPVDDSNEWGYIRHNNRAGPISTWDFEQWREGLEDYEYLKLLEQVVAEVEASPATEQLKWRLVRARELLAVPDTIARPIIHYWKTPPNHEELLAARDEIAELIAELTAALASD